MNKLLLETCRTSWRSMAMDGDDGEQIGSFVRRTIMYNSSLDDATHLETKMSLFQAKKMMDIWTCLLS